MELGNMAFGNSRGKYPVDRDWQDMFCKHLYEMGFDSRGDIDDENLMKDEIEIPSSVKEEWGNTKFENDTFIIMPYYWGDDDYISGLPNFVYKPTGFSLSWYKYALRDSYMNHNITKQKLEEYMIECKKSLGLIDLRHELLNELPNLHEDKLNFGGIQWIRGLVMGEVVEAELSDTETFALSKHVLSYLNKLEKDIGK